MSTKLTKNELVAQNAELSAKYAAAAGQVIDLENELDLLKRQMKMLYPQAAVENVSPRRAAMLAAKAEAMRTGHSVVVRA